MTFHMLWRRFHSRGRRNSLLVLDVLPAESLSFVCRVECGCWLALALAKRVSSLPFPGLMRSYITL